MLLLSDQQRQNNRYFHLKSLQNGGKIKFISVSAPASSATCVHVVHVRSVVNSAERNDERKRLKGVASTPLNNILKLVLKA